MPIDLAIGLPPAHFGAQNKAFVRYFKRKEPIYFSYRDKLYSILIRDVQCYPQAFAAAAMMLGELATVPRALILDVGGFTADYLLLKNGRADLSTCDSLENGVILLYNRIRSKVSSDLDVLLEETDVDAILLQGQGVATGKKSPRWWNIRRRSSSTICWVRCASDSLICARGVSSSWAAGPACCGDKSRHPARWHTPSLWRT